MLKVVENEPAVRRYQRRFVSSFKPLTDEVIPVELGHPGAHVRAKVAWSERLGIWRFSRRIADHRYWHAFGVGRPEGGAHIPITCEINFPLCGIDRRTGGAFAEDGAGRVFVVHRGKLGGGRKGVGKGLFENHYRGAWEVMDDGGAESVIAVIGVLNSPRFPRQIAHFVRKIALMKEAAAARSAQAEFRFDELTLHDEWIGDRFHEPEHVIGAECDHGLIIRDLALALRTGNLRTGNDGSRDLLAVNRAGCIRAVFQVRTEMALEGIHAGAAQLLMNGLDLTGNPLLVLALPGPPDESVRAKLKRLNIDLLIYRWEGDRAAFPWLADLLARIAT
ncbi:MAG: hypothetical protein LLG97_15125 [Deltaproteobacteria bacterium]|nr:hypothetical protein [Deltaproteobacteria bacterium]